MDVVQECKTIEEGHLWPLEYTMQVLVIGFTDDSPMATFHNYWLNTR